MFVCICNYVTYFLYSSHRSIYRIESQVEDAEVIIAERSDNSANLISELKTYSLLLATLKYVKPSSDPRFNLPEYWHCNCCALRNCNSVSNSILDPLDNLPCSYRCNYSAH